MALPTVTQVKCAACGRQYTQQVHQAIDAKKEPQLKSMLLQGRLNLTACPQCGTQGPLSMPMLYHDPDKSLFLSCSQWTCAAVWAATSRRLAC